VNDENDEKLFPPFAASDRVTDLARRTGGVDGSWTALLLPGWDWEVIIYGLAGAICRYRKGLGKSKGIAARVAVGEALWWVAAADEFLRKRVSGGMSQTAYYAAIQKTSAGRRFAGLVFLRNRAGHQLAAVLMQKHSAKTSVNVRSNDGSAQPLAITASLLALLSPFNDSPDDGYYFVPSSSLPLADAKHKEKFNRDAYYDELVAQRRVIDVFNAVERSLNNAVSFHRTDDTVHISVVGSGTLPTGE
jgi:hypothetical protein